MTWRSVLLFAVMLISQSATGQVRFDVQRHDAIQFAVARGDVPKQEVKPTVYVVYAPFPCPPCEDVKRQDWSNAPFTLTPGEKIRPLHFPWIHWEANGRWYYLDGWNGKAALVKTWEGTQGLGKGVILRSNNYNPRWTIRDGRNVADHLRAVHGVNPSGMSTADMYRWHDNLHEGTR